MRAEIRVLDRHRKFHSTNRSHSLKILKSKWQQLCTTINIDQLGTLGVVRNEKQPPIAKM